MVAGIFGLLLGLIGVAIAITKLRETAALRRWGTTSGSVIERGTFRITHATRKPPGFHHAPLVKYRYQVAGREYTNDAISPRHILLPAHSTQEWAEARAATYPDQVVVHYNPANAADSFLVPPSSKLLFVVLGFSAAAGLASLFFILGSLR